MNKGTFLACALSLWSPWFHHPAQQKIGRHVLTHADRAVLDFFVLLTPSNGELLKEFARHNNRMTLGAMMRFDWGYTARNRMAELRKLGYGVVFEKGSRPSDNLYTITPPDPQLKLFS